MGIICVAHHVHTRAAKYNLLQEQLPEEQAFAAEDFNTFVVQ